MLLKLLFGPYLHFLSAWTEKHQSIMNLLHMDYEILHAFAYLLHDVLPHLSHLSQIFQKKDVDLTLIQPYLKTTIDVIKEYKERPGPALSKVNEVLTTELKDFGIAPTPAEKETFKSMQSSSGVCLSIIVDELSNRFPNV